MSNENTSVSDFRRALLLYLISFVVLVYIMLLSLADFAGGMATPPSSSDSKTQNTELVLRLLILILLLITVSIQDWYLRAKHNCRRSEGMAGFVKQSKFEASALFLLIIDLIFIKLRYDRVGATDRMRVSGISIEPSLFPQGYLTTDAFIWVAIFSMIGYLPVILTVFINNILKKKKPSYRGVSRVLMSFVISVVGILFVLIPLAVLLFIIVGRGLF